ncbi:hypothetical protein TcCL_NonESM09524, partial [Trypanosoma cruzi]
AHHVDCWSTGSAANIRHKNNSVAFGLRSYSEHTTSCRSGHRSSSRTRNKKKQKRGGGVGDRGGAVAVGGGRCSFSFLVNDVVVNTSGCLAANDVERQLVS